MSDNGKYQVGDVVLLGRHQKTDIHGNPCTANWSVLMDQYVGYQVCYR